MKVKVFQPNSRGKIEFTRTELEKLLNEIYEEGRRDCEHTHHYPFFYSTPYYGDSITGTITTCNTAIDTKATDSIDKLTCTYDNVDAKKTETLVANNTAVDATPISITVGNVDREAARKHISDTVAALRRAQVVPGDVFTNLAKELNF